MIDHKGLHAKIKAKLKPDSPMPEGCCLLLMEGGSYLVTTPDAMEFYCFHTEFKDQTIGFLEWFANALGIPLEDNGYTDLVNAAEEYRAADREYMDNLQVTEWDMDAWVNRINDAKVSFEAALKRIKNETKTDE